MIGKKHHLTFLNFYFLEKYYIFYILIHISLLFAFDILIWYFTRYHGFKVSNRLVYLHISLIVFTSYFVWKLLLKAREDIAISLIAFKSKQRDRISKQSAISKKHFLLLNFKNIIFQTYQTFSNHCLRFPHSIDGDLDISFLEFNLLNFVSTLSDLKKI